MNTLSCPVCQYQEILGNSCPNCDTDLSLIRSLRELPPSIPQVTHSKAGWQVGVALLILIIGIGLGALGSFLLLQPSQLLTNTGTSPSPVAVSSRSKTSPSTNQKTDTASFPSFVAVNRGSTLPPSTQQSVKRQQQRPQSTHYVVKLGDSLSSIAERFYGNGGLWSSLIKANPQLKGRENFLEIGEALIIPNREGTARGTF